MRGTRSRPLEVLDCVSSFFKRENLTIHLSGGVEPNPKGNVSFEAVYTNQYLEKVT